MRGVHVGLCAALALCACGSEQDEVVGGGETGGSSLVQTFNAAIPALVKTRADGGKHIVMVDMYGGFTSNASYKTDYMADKLHPKDAGYAKMADVWYAAIGSLLR